jgi:hypothetical protein
VDEDLPPDLEQRLDLLSSRGKDGARAAAHLRQRYAEATTELARKNVARAADALMKPTTGRWLWALLVCVPLSVLGLSFWSSHHHAEKVSGGQRALAKVVRLDEGFCWFGSKKSECVGLTLEVHPDGGPPFEATLDHDLPHRHLPRVQPGSWLYVAIESGEKNSILLDEEALAEEPPTGVDRR